MRYYPTQTVSVAAAFLMAACAQADTVLFTEDFNDMAAATRWSTSTSGTVVSSSLAFDYSSLGIGTAPGDTGTIGMMLDSSSGGSAVAIAASPNGQSFSGDFILNYKMYMLVGTGNTTEFTYSGINHSSGVVTASTSAGISNNGFDFALTGDSGTTRDVRVYNAGTELVGNPAGGYTSTTSTVQSFEQAGSTYSAVGPQAGNRWLDVNISQIGTTLSWSVNNIKFAERAVVPGSGNILLGYTDFFTGQPAAANTYIIYDNVTVTAVPEPGVGMLGLAAGFALMVRRRIRP